MSCFYFRPCFQQFQSSLLSCLGYICVLGVFFPIKPKAFRNHYKDLAVSRFFKCIYLFFFNK